MSFKKKFIKRSRFETVKATEYFSIPAKVMWVEHVVAQFFDVYKILKQCRRMDLGDLFYLFLFPVRLIMTILFSGFSHEYESKKFWEKYGNDGSLKLRNESYYTLDWKHWFSNMPRAWDQY
mgnify:CR=1 FL=1